MVIVGATDVVCNTPLSAKSIEGRGLKLWATVSGHSNGYSNVCKPRSQQVYHVLCACSSAAFSNGCGITQPTSTWQGENEVSPESAGSWWCGVHQRWVNFVQVRPDRLRSTPLTFWIENRRSSAVERRSRNSSLQREMQRRTWPLFPGV